MKKSLAVIIAVLIVIPLVTASLFMVSVRSWATDRQFYVRLLTDDRLFAAADAVISAGIAVDKGGPDASSSATVSAATGAAKGKTVIEGITLDSKAFSAAALAAFPKAEYKAAATSAIDALFSGKGKAEVDLGALKAKMSANADRFALSYLEALPEGKPADKADFSVRPAGVSAAAFAASARPALQKSWMTIVSKVPDKAPVEGPQGRDGAGWQSAQAGLASGITFALIVGIAFWILGAFLWDGRWASRLSYLGTTLMVSSVLVLAVGAIGAMAANAQNFLKFAELCGAKGVPAVAQEAVAAVNAYVTFAFGPAIRSLLWTGFIGACVGGGLLSLRWAVAAKEV